jgi:carbon-monoxide dehydrogenase medium subunit
VFVSNGPAGPRVGVTGAKACAFRWTEAERALASKGWNPGALDGLAVDPSDLNADLHASADYRASLVATLATRAVAESLAPPSAAA